MLFYFSGFFGFEESRPVGLQEFDEAFLLLFGIVSEALAQLGAEGLGQAALT